MPDWQWLVREVVANPDITSSFGHRVNSLDTLVAEMLHNITVYFENMLPNDLGTLLTPNGAKLCSEFDSYCFTAIMLLAKGLVNEFRCTISQATILLN
jgi:hypothetical protein